MIAVSEYKSPELGQTTEPECHPSLPLSSSCLATRRLLFTSLTPDKRSMRPWQLGRNAYLAAALPEDKKENLPGAYLMRCRHENDVGIDRCRTDHDCSHG
jgi:hypothetical protein